jgi:RND family efflux transporter MFP subunit
MVDHGATKKGPFRVGWARLMQSLNTEKTGLEASLPKVLPQESLPAKVPALRIATAPKLDRKRPWFWALATALVLAAGVALWYFQPWVAKISTVAVETIAPSPLSRVLAVNGRIATLHPVNVTATVSGTVLTVLKNEGDKVAVGDLLVIVDASGQEAAVRQARASLDSGTVAQDQAASNVARLTALGTNSARTALEDANRSLQSADQEVGRLTALFQQAEILLAKYRINAPIAGTVLTRGIEPGQTADAATVLFTLSDLSAPVVQTEVDEAYASQIVLGQVAVLQLVGETATHSGKVSIVSPTVNADTGALVVKIAPDEPIAAPVGLTVTANIIVDKEAAALSVPRTALTSGAGIPAVLVMQAGVAHKREVAVIDWPAARLIVTSGLVAGDVIITDASGIKDGQTVKAAAK